jgi:ABC-type Fe3+/spermidine/putrescine transport system ATPase subunit
LTSRSPPLDTQTRDQLRDELLSFLRALSIPAVFVTHDHTDARTLADKIVVLRAGTAMQIGSAPEVFQKPANAFVARFVGVENILSGHVRDLPATFAHVEVAGRTLRAGGPALAGAAPRSVQVGIRAEDVILYPDPASGGELAPDGDSNRLEGRVIGLRALGPLTSVELDCGFPLKSYLLARQAREMNLTLGELVAVEIAASAVHVMID